MTARKRTATKPAPVPSTKYGAYLANVHISQQGVVHNEHTVAAVTALANGVIANAEALKAAANALNGDGVRMGHGIHLSDLRADNATR